jgi:S-DNA-T family DNA segregation ATPase FtsK/SpoIIIE
LARCEECGFDEESVSPSDAPGALRAFARRYRAPLTRLLPAEDDAVLRQRPDPSTWSALEYTCHVRDLFDVSVDRLRRTLEEDNPTLESMQRDERAVRDRYNDQDPLTVADQVAASAERLAAVVEGIETDGWDRTAVYPYPEPAPRTVLWMTRHVVHEGSHHLLDVGRVLRAVRGR